MVIGCIGSASYHGVFRTAFVRNAISRYVPLSSLAGFPSRSSISYRVGSSR